MSTRRARYLKNKAAGRCTKHPSRPAAHGKASCEECLWKNKERRYGLNKEKAALLYYAQGGDCQACGGFIPYTDLLMSHSDHCHALQNNKGVVAVRGILHKACNLLVGQVETHGVDKYLAAVAYVDAWRRFVETAKPSKRTKGKFWIPLLDGEQA